MPELAIMAKATKKAAPPPTLKLVGAEPQPAKPQTGWSSPDVSHGPILPPPETSCRCKHCIVQLRADYKRAKVPCPPMTDGPCRFLRSQMPNDVLSAAPTELNNLAGFFQSLTPAQLRRGWKPCLMNALVQELDDAGVLTHPKSKGILGGFLRSIEVVHTRFVRVDPKPHA